MYQDITDFFLSLIEQTGSYDIAEIEFKRQLSDDETLRSDYIEWCDSMGYTERNGFNRFCQTHREMRDDRWDSINEYDDQE